jgi:hypothetical protein
MSDLRNAVTALNNAQREMAAAARRLGRVEQASRHNGGAVAGNGQAPDRVDVGAADRVAGGNSRLIVVAPGIDRATLVRQAREFGRQQGIDIGVYSAVSGRNLLDR